MRLYHGSLEKVESPRILPRALYCPLDFGTGFYTTSDYEQARKWVVNRLRHSSVAKTGFVSVYDFDETLSLDLRVKRFNGVTVEWLRFIAANRLDFNIEHGFDVVIGPVADDRVYTVLSLFEGGYIDEQSAMARMKAYRLANQYLFHTERSLSLLRYVSSLEVAK